MLGYHFPNEFLKVVVALRPSLDGPAMHHNASASGSSADHATEDGQVWLPGQWVVDGHVLDGEVHVLVAGAQPRSCALGHLEDEGIEALTSCRHRRNHGPRQRAANTTSTAISMPGSGIDPGWALVHAISLRRANSAHPGH